MKPARFSQRALLLACAAVWAVGCEKHVVSTNPGNDYMGMHFAPTQVQSPPPPPQPPQPWSFPNPFKWIGDGFSGFAGLFKGNDKSIQINGQGQTMQVPANYTGQTNFTAADGRNYHLHFENGALVGVEPQTPSAPPKSSSTPPQ